MAGCRALFFCFFAFNPLHRQQGQAQITNLAQQAMQSSLISHAAHQQGFVIRLRRDRKTFESVQPFLVQNPPDPDLVDAWLVESFSIGHEHASLQFQFLEDDRMTAIVG